MANQSISQLPVATTLTGDELTVVVQGGVTKQTQVMDIANVVIPGKLIDYLYFDGASDLIVVYTDSTTQNLGPIPGFIAATIAPNGHLILTNSDGGTTDAGSVFATLSQTFITANNESSTLPNSQQLIAGNNISLTSGANSITIATSGSAGSLNDAGIGLIAKDTSTSVIARELTSGSSGISITNGDGQAGNPTIGLSGRIGDIEALNTSGLLVMQNGTDVVNRVLVGTASQIDVVDGDGLFGNPTISINNNPVLPGTGSVTVPQGNTAQRPGALPGQIRFNTQLNLFEGQDNSGTWQTLALGGGVTLIDTGTGLTGGPITSTGTISLADTTVSPDTYGSSNYVPTFTVDQQGRLTSAGETEITPSGIGAISQVDGTANEITTSQLGTVVTVSLPTALTFTGKTVTGGTLSGVTIDGATNTLSNIGNSSLTNSAVTFNGQTVSLGGSGTITANTTNALTIGTGLSGTSFNGSSAVTIAISNTGVTAASYGDASKTLTATVNAQGQLTALADTAIAIANTQVSGLGTASTLNAGVAGGVATLDGGGTVPVSQLPAAVLGALKYQGVWDASTNTPTLTSSVGTQGYYYVVDVAGTTNLNGITDWKVGDWAIFNGSVWQKIDNTDAVTSVNGYTGTVVLSYTDVGAQVAGTYVNSVSATAPLTSTGGTTPTLAMPAATTSVDGYLTSTDWNTFNNKTSNVGTVTSVSGTGTVNGLTLTGTVTTSGSLTLGGTLDLSSPPAIGGTTPAAITGTTITATTYVGISGGTF